MFRILNEGKEKNYNKHRFFFLEEISFFLIFILLGLLRRLRLLYLNYQ
jgi:hypothetical protein